LLSLVEKYGYDDIAAALRERGGLPDPEQAYLTGGIENIDDFSACQITRKEDWVDQCLAGGDMLAGKDRLSGGR
jgi:hypothetical protein